MKPTESLERILTDRVQFRRRPRKEAARRQAKSLSPIEPDFENLPAVGTMARTKRLILAALRVWELKHGIRD